MYDDYLYAPDPEDYGYEQDPETPLPDYWHVECNWDPDGEWEEPNVIDMDGLLVCCCETVELAHQLCEKHNARVKEAEDDTAL